MTEIVSFLKCETSEDCDKVVAGLSSYRNYDPETLNEDEKVGQTFSMTIECHRNNSEYVMNMFDRNVYSSEKFNDGDVLEIKAVIYDFGIRVKELKPMVFRNGGFYRHPIYRYHRQYHQ